MTELSISGPSLFYSCYFTCWRTSE